MKPQTSHVARAIINPTAAETNTGREKAGHWFFKGGRGGAMLVASSNFLANAKEYHQTSGSFLKIEHLELICGFHQISIQR